MKSENHWMNPTVLVCRLGKLKGRRCKEMTCEDAMRQAVGSEKEWFQVLKSQSLTLIFLVRLQPTRSSTTLKRQKIKVEKQMLMPPTLLPTCWAQEVQSLQTREEKASPLLSPGTPAACLTLTPAPLHWLSRATRVS